MLALEDQSISSFPTNMLSRKTFASIESVVDAVQKLGLTVALARQPDHPGLYNRWYPGA